MIRTEAALIAQRPVVRVRMVETKEKSNTEILTAVRTVIQRTYAVKMIRSGNIEVMISD